MLINVTAKPKKKTESVIKNSPVDYAVSVKEPPVQGRANLAIIRVLAKYFQISESEIEITSGLTAKHKTVKIPDRLVDYEPPNTQKPLFKVL